MLSRPQAAVLNAVCCDLPHSILTGLEMICIMWPHCLKLIIRHS